MEVSLLLFFLLLLGVAVVAYIIGKFLSESRLHQHYENVIVSQRKDAVTRSRAVLTGHFSEQLAPFLPDYPFSPTETKFLGKPIDLLVFEGSDEKNISEVVFVEVKSGKSTLNKQEKSLKKAVEDKKVRWFEYRIDEELTKQKNKKEEV